MHSDRIIHKKNWRDFKPANGDVKYKKMEMFQLEFFKFT